MSKTIAVIGGGTAGLTAAIGLAKAGYPVVLIEKEFLGGECTNTGCVPSKALLYQARQVATLKENLQQVKELGEQQLKTLLSNKAQQALDSARGVRQQFRAHESRQWLEEQGVGLIQAAAVFTGKKSLSLKDINYVSPWVQQEHTEVKNENFLFFDRCIIATGSRPRLPGVLGLDKVPYFTNETIFDLERVPEHLLIIGNGAVGVEMANAFHNLGSQVTVIGQSSNLLKGVVDREVGAKLQLLLQEKGIRFAKGKVVGVKLQEEQINLTTESGVAFLGSHVLLATGRLPNTQLGLEKAEVRYDERGIKINKYSQTSTDNIYALGDCCPVPHFTHFAYYQAKKLVTNLTVKQLTKLPLEVVSFRKRRIPSVIYTDFEIAQYGFTEAQARKKWADRVGVHYLRFEDVDRAKLHDGEPGMIKIITKGPLARLVGVCILASRAGEMLPEFQRIISNRESITSLDAIIRAYPSYTSSLDRLYIDWLFNKLPL